MKIDKNTTLEELQDYVRQYTEARGFTKDPTVKFLKLVEEVGELSKALGSTVGMKSDATRNRGDVEEEIADTLFVLLGVAYTLNIDIADALQKKDAKNQKRKWK